MSTEYEKAIQSLKTINAETDALIAQWLTAVDALGDPNASDAVFDAADRLGQEIQLALTRYGAAATKVRQLKGLPDLGTPSPDDDYLPF